MAEIIMPKMGDAMEEGVIVQWLKQVGDTVTADEALLEIETDKSNVEVPAGTAGVVHEIRFPAGSTVPVGSAVAVIGAGAPPAAGTVPAEAPKTEAKPEKPAPTPSQPAVVAEPAAPVTPAPVTVVATNGVFRPYGDTFVGMLPENLGGTASVLGEMIELAGAESGTVVGEGRVKASPLARAMAVANNLNLATLGVTGTVTAADVEAAMKKGSPATPTEAAASEVEVQAYSGMRKTIARRLTESKQQIPHFYVTVEIDMEELLQLRERVNVGAGDGVVKVSVNDCLVKAVSVALLAVPTVNSRFEDNKRLVSKGHHLGFGVALPDGLIVPVVRNVERLSLRQVASASKPLIEKARAGKLQPADYTGGTFTISNLGAMAEVENFAAIVNPGEGAILAVSATRTVPAVVGGQIVPRKRMKVTLSADHRVVDGADAAAFLGALKRVIENPLEMLV